MKLSGLLLLSILSWLSCAASLAGAGLQVLHSFGNTDGSQPYGEVLLVGDVLFGTSNTGGSHNAGTIFRLNTDGTGFQVLHHFGSIPKDGRVSFGGLVFDGVSLYGTTKEGGAFGTGGTLFAVRPDGTEYRTIHDFRFPEGGASEAGLVLYGTTLYGTTSLGGSNGHGTVFAIDTDGTGFQVIHSFLFGASGASPFGGVLLEGDRLYGTTYTGGPGPGSGGTVFALNRDGSDFQVLHQFIGRDGANSGADLALADDRLYGTTLAGGPDRGSRGVLFAVGTDGSDFEVLHAFQGVAGARPGGGVTIIGNTIYGTAIDGGQSNQGLLFSINTDGLNFRSIHDFSSQPLDGAQPLPLRGFAVQGNRLFGTSLGGGSGGFGTVFSITIPEPRCLILMSLAGLVCLGFHRPTSGIAILQNILGDSSSDDEQ